MREHKATGMLTLPTPPIKITGEIKQTTKLVWKSKCKMGGGYRCLVVYNLNSYALQKVLLDASEDQAVKNMVLSYFS